MALTQISTQGIKDGTITGTDLATNVDLVDNQKLRLGNSQDLQIFHDGSDSFIQDVGTGKLNIVGDTDIDIKSTGGELKARFVTNGAVELYFDNSLKFKTDSIGCEIAGALIIPDGSASGNRISVGNAGDLAIFHDGSNSFVRNSTGGLDLNSDTIHLRNGANSETYARFLADGAVELYFDNNKKFETNSTGCFVAGSLGVNPSSSGNLDVNKEGTGTLINLRTTGTARGNISSNGSTVQFNTSASDKSLKKNFENWTENTLALFKNINAQKFNYLDQEDGVEKEKGFIAQDMVLSFPEAYQKNNDDKYMFNPSGMVVYLMKAIQELEAEVAALKAG